MIITLHHYVEFMPCVVLWLLVNSVAVDVAICSEVVKWNKNGLPNNLL